MAKERSVTEKRAPELKNSLLLVFRFLHSQIFTVSSRTLYKYFRIEKTMKKYSKGPSRVSMYKRLPTLRDLVSSIRRHFPSGCFMQIFNPIAAILDELSLIMHISFFAFFTSTNSWENLKKLQHSVLLRGTSVCHNFFRFLKNVEDT